MLEYDVEYGKDGRAARHCRTGISSQCLSPRHLAEAHHAVDFNDWYRGDDRPHRSHRT